MKKKKKPHSPTNHNKINTNKVCIGFYFYFYFLSVQLVDKEMFQSFN
jgi:hypothetical protein